MSIKTYRILLIITLCLIAIIAWHASKSYYYNLLSTGQAGIYCDKKVDAIPK